MLSSKELTTLFDEVGVTQRGREIVLAARLGAPVRDVGSQLSNMLVEFPSTKMPEEVELRAESRTLEQAVLFLHEHDPDVLEYYTQPYRFHLTLQTASGNRPVVHVPDVMTIRRDAIAMEETRSDERLHKLCEKYPWRYRESEGVWHDDVFESHLAQLGIQYRLRPKSSLPGFFLRNSELLSEHFSRGAAVGRSERMQLVKSLFASQPVRLFNDVLSYVNDPLLIFEAIAAGGVYVDLREQLLSNTDELVLYRDQQAHDFLIAAGKVAPVRRYADMQSLDLAKDLVLQIGDDRATVISTNESRTLIRRADGNLDELGTASLKRLIGKGSITVTERPRSHAERLGLLEVTRLTAVQTERAEAVLCALENNQATATIAPWTLNRARRKLELAETVTDAIEALAPQYHKRGNRVSRHSTETIALAKRLIKREYNTPVAKTAKAVHEEYQTEATKLSLDIIAYPTFSGMCTAMTNIAKRHGRRASYQKTMPPLNDPEDLPTPDRPFQLVHIDHTEVDVECKSGRTGANLGRPWATIARDAKTKRVLGLFLTFQPPSLASLFGVLRDVVRRFGRLPEAIVLDGGPEMRSHSMKVFDKKTRTRLLRRPKAQPRAGQEIEQIFGLVNVRVVHQMPGNTKQMKDPRNVSSSHHAERHAEFTLPALAGSLEHACFTLFDNDTHLELQMTPRECQDMLDTKLGIPASRVRAFDREFRILTSPHPRRRLHRLDPVRGIKVGDHYFRNDLLRDAPMPARKYEVRVDPWNASLVYVDFEGKWIDCINPRIAQLGIGTRKELGALFDEWKQSRMVARQRRRSEHDFFEWVRVRDPKEWDIRLRDQTTELKISKVLLPLVETTATPFTIEEAQPKLLVAHNTVTTFREADRPREPRVIVLEDRAHADDDITESDNEFETF